MGYNFRNFVIRDQMLAALEDYVKAGAPLGDFLRCVVSNDFVGACGHADAENLYNLPAFAAWVYNECPSQAWGSRDKYERWLKDRCDLREAYIKMLRSHDWEYIKSEDERVWAEGRAKLALLQRMQREVDPHAVIWNQVCPNH